MVGGSHGGTEWIPFPLPPLSAWGAPGRPNITIGPILAAASCVLAIFRPSYFIPHNFHESTTKPQPEPQTCSPPEDTVRSRRGTEDALDGQRGLGPPWCLAVHLSLALSAPAGSQVAWAQQVPATLPGPSGKKGGSPTGARGH